MAHPLSHEGLATYDFAIRDSLTVQTPQQSLRLYEVYVRPREENQPGVIGAVYLDRETGAVARMALTFTAHAFLDKRIETLSVVLENARIGQFWLPSHQEIEVVRQNTWLDFPARGIIRARWDVCVDRSGGIGQPNDADIALSSSASAIVIFRSAPMHAAAA